MGNLSGPARLFSAVEGLLSRQTRRLSDLPCRLYQRLDQRAVRERYGARNKAKGSKPACITSLSVTQVFFADLQGRAHEDGACYAAAAIL